MDFTENAAPPPASLLVITGKYGEADVRQANQRARDAALARRRAAQRALELPPAPMNKRKARLFGPIPILR